MFKNKKIVALVLLTLMVLAPFASAFAAVPKEDYLDKYKTATAVKGGADVDSDISVFKTAAETYAADGDAVTYKAAKKTLTDELEAQEDALKGAKAAKVVAERFTAAEYSAAFNSTYSTPADAKAVFDSAKEEYEQNEKNVKDIKGALKDLKLYEELGDLMAQAKAIASDENDAFTFLGKIITAFNAYNESQQAIAAPVVKKAFDRWAKLVQEKVALSYLEAQSEAVQKAVGKIASDEKKLEKDGYKVWAPEAAPEALNGAVELRLTKNDKGNTLMKLYDKDGKEVESKGLLYVRMPIPKGVTANKIKVDGVETTFKVVDGTWEFAAEFKIAK